MFDRKYRVIHLKDCRKENYEGKLKRWTEKLKERKNEEISIRKQWNREKNLSLNGIGDWKESEIEAEAIKIMSN